MGSKILLHLAANICKPGYPPVSKRWHKEVWCWWWWMKRAGDTMQEPKAKHYHALIAFLCSAAAMLRASSSKCCSSCSCYQWLTDDITEYHWEIGCFISFKEHHLSVRSCCKGESSDTQSLGTAHYTEWHRTRKIRDKNTGCYHFSQLLQNTNTVCIKLV